MSGIYLLAALFYQLSSGANFFSLSNDAFPTIQPGPSQMIIRFEKLHSLEVGDPVLVKGQPIGIVESITTLQVERSLSENTFPESGISKVKTNNNLNHRQQKKASANLPPCAVQIQISSASRDLLKQGTVALLSSHASTTSAKRKYQLVIELFSPTADHSALLPDGTQISGYSSYEDFWSSNASKDGLEAGGEALAELQVRGRKRQRSFDS